MSTPEEQTPLNQTQFSFEEPIFEKTAALPQEKPDKEVAEAPKSGKKKILLIIGGVFFLLILLLIVVVLRNREAVIEETLPEEVVQTTQERTPLQERIIQARELLLLADPTKDELAFPPIDLSFRLEEKKR